MGVEKEEYGKPGRVDFEERKREVVQLKEIGLVGTEGWAVWRLWRLPWRVLVRACGGRGCRHASGYFHRRRECDRRLTSSLVL